MFTKFLKSNSGYTYFVFRILIGILFLMHGLMKWPKIASGVMDMFWFAGVIEIVGGAFLIVGLFVTYTAVLTAVEMLVAFFTVHAKDGVYNPLGNGGEPAVLFFAAFLVLMSHGAGMWSLDKMLGKNKR